MIAGILGLGVPEIAFILLLFAGLSLPALIAVMIFARMSHRGGPTRFCPACGRGLTQAMDAPFCSYCGVRLP